MNQLTQLVRQLIDEDQTILATAASLPGGRRFLNRQLARAEYEIEHGHISDSWARDYAARIKRVLAEYEDDE